MTGAIAPLSDSGLRARGSLLEIMLLVLGSILLTRLVLWVRGKSELTGSGAISSLPQLNANGRRMPGR